MIKLFKWRIATKQEIDVLEGVIYGVAEGVHDRVAKHENELHEFKRKFDDSMDFIGRNLPLKRKRKAFFKIVK